MTDITPISPCETCTIYKYTFLFKFHNTLISSKPGFMMKMIIDTLMILLHL